MTVNLFALILILFLTASNAVGASFTSGSIRSLSGDIGDRRVSLTADDGTVFTYHDIGSFPNFRVLPCTGGTCTVNLSGTLSNTLLGERRLGNTSTGYWAFSFTITGPSVSATAIPDCLGCPPPLAFNTNWGPVPATLTGTVTLRSLLDPTAVEGIIPINVQGLVSAYSYHDQDLGPWNYTTIDFVFTPEPASAQTALQGLLALAATRRVSQALRAAHNP